MAKNTLQAEIQGGDELAKVLRQLPGELKGAALDKAARAGAKVIAEEARENAPEGEGHPKFGHLRDNIRAKKAPKRVRLDKLESHYIVHNGDAFWGLFLEFGTVKMDAQPWFRPAIDASLQRAIQTTGEKAFKAVQLEARKLAGKFGALGKTRKRRLAR